MTIRAQRAQLAFTVAATGDIGTPIPTGASALLISGAEEAASVGGLQESHIVGKPIAKSGFAPLAIAVRLPSARPNSLSALSKSKKEKPRECGKRGLVGEYVS
jgi:hypothetical protein